MTAKVSSKFVRLMLGTAAIMTVLTGLAAAQEAVTLQQVVVEGEGTGEGVAEGTGFSGYAPRSQASATKGDAPLSRTPQAVSAVGATQIADQAARTVTEATRYSPGIRSETFGNDVRNDWFLIRGFTSQVSSYFLDGLQLQSSDSFATWKVNPYTLERIDVLRGPSGALYGASNPGGLINMVSKRPDFRNGGEVGVGINEHGNLWSGVDVQGVNEDKTWAYRIVGTGNYGDTEVDFIENDQFAIAPSLTWAPTEATKLNIYANVSRLETRGQNFLPYEGTEIEAPFGYIPRALFTSEPSIDKFERSQALVGYEFEHAFNDRLTVRQNLRYGHLDVDFRNVYGQGWASPPTATSALLARGNFLTRPELDLFNVDNQVEFKADTGPLAHTFLFGLDYKHFDLDDEAGFVAGPSFDVLNPVYAGAPDFDSRYNNSRTKQNQIGLYAQDRIDIDRLTLVFSGRYDDVSTKTDDRLFGNDVDTSTDELSGRAGIIYNFDNGISPWASVSRSFLPVIGTDSATNSPFVPETGTQYEAGVRYQPEAWNGGLIGASVFDLTRQNVVTSDGVLFNRQIGEVHSRGFELEAVGQITPNLKLIGAYTWYDIEIEEGNPFEVGNRPVATPDNFGSLWVDYTFLSGTLEGVSLGGGVRYVGDSYADGANTLKVSDSVVADAAIRYERNNFEAALNVSNIFDERFVDSCNSASSCFYGEGREANLTLKFKW